MKWTGEFWLGLAVENTVMNWTGLFWLRIAL